MNNSNSTITHNLIVRMYVYVHVSAVCMYIVVLTIPGTIDYIYYVVYGAKYSIKVCTCINSMYTAGLKCILVLTVCNTYVHCWIKVCTCFNSM